MCVTTLSVYGAASLGRWRVFATAGGATAGGGTAGGGTAGALLLLGTLGGSLYIPLLVVTMMQNEK